MRETTPSQARHNYNILHACSNTYTSLVSILCQVEDITFDTRVLYHDILAVDDIYHAFSQPLTPDDISATLYSAIYLSIYA